MRVGKRCAVVERQSHSVRCRGDRDNAIGRTLGRAVTQYEEVIVVPNEFVRSGQPFSQRLAQAANQCLVLWLELVDEALELFFGVR